MSSSRARAGAPSSPRSSSGTCTFSSAVSVGMSWKLWNTKPTFSPRSWARLSSSSAVRSAPSSEHGAARRDVEAGEQAEQRRLAAAGRSDDGDERASGDREADVAQHGERVVAAPVFLRQLAGFEHEIV